MNKTLRKIFRYFLQGVVLLSPILLTIWLAYFVFDFIDKLIPFKLPTGVGFIAVVSGFILAGWLASKFFLWQVVIDIFDRIMEKIPGLKLVYTSIKDFVEGFMGEKRKFNKPVLITMSFNPPLQRIGFITQDDLSDLDIQEKVMVYIPHSYNFSGNMYIVEKENIQLLKMDAAKAMKIAVTGGVAGWKEEEKTTSNES